MIHYVEVYMDEAYLARLAEIRPVTDEDRKDAHISQLICPDPDNCPGWEECREPHIVDGQDAFMGPYEGEEGYPWDDVDEFEFHGVLHTWNYGFGWTVPFKGCVAREAYDFYGETPDGIPMDRPGMYEVEEDWYDESTCYFNLIKEVDPQLLDT